MTMQTGDTATIRRGKLAGGTGEVIAINPTEAVLKLPDGKFSTQALTNLKAPEVPSVTADQLAEAFKVTLADAQGQDGPRALYLLANHLEAHIPGFRSRLPWPSES